MFVLLHVRGFCHCRCPIPGAAYEVVIVCLCATFPAADDVPHPSDGDLGVPEPGGPPPPPSPTPPPCSCTFSTTPWRPHWPPNPGWAASTPVRFHLCQRVCELWVRVVPRVACLCLWWFRSAGELAMVLYNTGDLWTPEEVTLAKAFVRCVAPARCLRIVSLHVCPGVLECVCPCVFTCV